MTTLTLGLRWRETPTGDDTQRKRPTQAEAGLHEVIRALGYEPGEGDSTGMSEQERRKILEALENGEISYEDAMQMLEEGGD